MISLVSLLVAAALVSQQCGFEANALIEDSKLTIDNRLLTNVETPAKRPRRLQKFVRIRPRPAAEVKRVTGERVELDCEAVGHPPPAIYWMKNGETVIDPSEEINEIIPSSTTGLGRLISKLIVTDAGLGADEYSCVAEAGMKRDTATTTVFTVPTDSDEEDLLALQKLFLLTPPVITYHYTEVFLDQGSMVLLPCRVASLGDAQVAWKDNNERNVHGNPRMRVLTSGDLLISSLRWSDMGNFTCIAKNAYGKDSIDTFVYPTKPEKWWWGTEGRKARVTYPEWEPRTHTGYESDQLCPICPGYFCSGLPD